LCIIKQIIIIIKLTTHRPISIDYVELLVYLTGYTFALRNYIVITNCKYVIWNAMPFTLGVDPFVIFKKHNLIFLFFLLRFYLTTLFKHKLYLLLPWNIGVDNYKKKQDFFALLFFIWIFNFFLFATLCFATLPTF